MNAVILTVTSRRSPASIPGLMITPKPITDHLPARSTYKYDDTNGWFYSVGTTATDGTGDGKGNFSIGVYGNILNWLTVSRIDGALQAMIGGRAVNSSGSECSSTDTDCYVKMQGARRVGNATIQIKPSGTVQTADPAQVYIRPSTWTSTDVATGISDVWNSSSHMYPYLDLVMTSMGQYVGTISTGDTTWTANNSLYELWSFTIGVATKVDLSLTGAWSSSYGCYLQIMSANTPDTYIARGSSSNSASTTLTTNLTAGTYYVLVGPYKKNSATTFCSTSGCICATTGACDYALKANVTLSPVSPATGTNSRTTQSAICPTIGGIANARVRIKIAATDRSGAVQKTWNQARWGFMYYKGDSSSNYGKLLVRCGELSDSSQFCAYMAGGHTASPYPTNGDPFPYNGTPTGEALNEVINYFKQSGGINSSLFTIGSQYDPYYTSQMIDNAYLPVPCRQSFVILVSDGVWNGSVDPVVPAYKMHTTDLRTDSGLTGTQSVTVYPLFAFNASGTTDYTQGSNAMQWIALFGGFTDLSSTTCKTGWPYPLSCGSSLTPSSCIGGASTSVTFSTKFTSTCQKTTPDSCCKEWDVLYDMYTVGDGLGKGVPDNYFDCRYASQLETAIETIVTRITQQTASSSAVATISQKTGEGDVIIRGLFEANPPSTDAADQGRLLWYGHLEAYWPNSSGVYSFEIYTSDIMCKTIKTDAGSDANCWDAATSPPWPAATSLSTSTSPMSGRNIFTMVNGVQTSFNVTNMTSTLLGVSTSTDATNLVNWVLGVENTSLFRSRTDPSSLKWILGDIIYSTPVVVGPPTLGAVSQNLKAILNNKEIGVVSTNSDAKSAGFYRDYLTWRQVSATSHSKPDIKYRDKFAFVGGNDGMLHAFLVARSGLYEPEIFDHP